jgi:ElaA protein
MKEVSIGRVITTERGKGYGKQIMLHAIDAAIKHFSATLIDIEAQEYAKGFYESVGFKQSSDTFILDGIPHIKMTWKIVNPTSSVSLIQQQYHPNPAE